MAYEPTQWKAGDIITSSKMNKIERQLASNTAEIESAIGDSDSTLGSLETRINDMIIISDTQPDSENNEIWINGSGRGIQIPTYEDFNSLVDSIGDTDNLETTAKTNLVAAINEVVQNSSINPEDIAEAVTDWLDENVTSGETLIVDQSLSIPGAAADAKETGDKIGELRSAIGDDWNQSTQTIVPTSSATAGYAYFSPVAVGSSISLSTNAGHSYFTYTNLTPGKTYHFKTYANTSWNNNHIVFANSSNKVTGYAIGQQSTAGSVEADVTVPDGTTLTYVICNKGTTDTATSIEVSIYDLIPLTTDVKNISEDLQSVKTDLQSIETATASDVGKALSAKTIEDGKVIEWEFKDVGGGGEPEQARYTGVNPVQNSIANGRTNATVGSTVSFGTQTDWYHAKYVAEAGKTYRATYFSSNSSKYNNIVAVDSSEKVLSILNDTPSGAGVITKQFVAPTNTAFVYLCNYGAIGRAEAVLHLEEESDLTDSERLDNVEKQATSASFNITNHAVSAYYNNVMYQDGDYTTSEANAYINNPQLVSRSDIPDPVVIRWNPINNAKRVTVTVSKDAVMFYARYKSYDCDPTSASICIFNLEPNATYYYQVTATLESGIDAILAKGQFTTENSIVRMLKIDGLQNVRDIGGMPAGSSTVAYGKVFRGSELDGAGFSSSASLTATNGTCKITDQGRDELINRIGVRAELDLRAGGTPGLLPSLDYQNIGFPFYENVLTGDGLTALGTAFGFIKTELSASKPVYAHCQGGNDRTGTLATCLLGLLGVNENALSKEYELSSFVYGDARLRNSSSYKYGALMAGILALTGDSLADKFATLFTSAGASASDITAFRNLMLV